MAHDARHGSSHNGHGAVDRDRLREEIHLLETSLRYWQARWHHTPGPSDPGTPRDRIQQTIDLLHQELEPQAGARAASRVAPHGGVGPPPAGLGRRRRPSARRITLKGGSEDPMNRPRWVQHNGWAELGESIHAGTPATAGDASQTGDAEVERLVARGDYRSALEALVGGYQHLIVRYCVAMLGDAGQGEEVAQEVFLGAYAALPRFRREASVRTWLLAIARKQCLKALRDRRRRRHLEEAQRQAIAREAHRAPPDPAEEDPETLRRRVRQGLDRLGPAERTVLLLRYETGLTLAEVAHVVGRSEAGVRRQLARALAQLRRVLEAAP